MWKDALSSGEPFDRVFYVEHGTRVRAQARPLYEAGKIVGWAGLWGSAGTGNRRRLAPQHDPDGDAPLSDFDKALDFVLRWEGGKADDPHDRGGRTNRGITQLTYNAYRKAKGLEIADVWDATLAETGDIYQKRFWVRLAPTPKRGRSTSR